MEDRGIGLVLRDLKADWSEAALTFWEFNDKQKNTLAAAVARLMVSHVSVAMRIAAGGEVPAIDQAVKFARTTIEKRLRISADKRDGLLFQHIMWLAKVWNSSKQDIVRSPQIRAAEHGQDGFIVHLETDESIKAVTICEDKCVGDAQETFREKVLDEIKEYETGIRDDELKSETLALLRGIASIERAQSAANVFWDTEPRRRYRVSLTYQPEAARGPRRQYLSGFANVVKERTARTGDIVIVVDLRHWMEDFATRVESALTALADGKASEDV